MSVWWCYYFFFFLLIVRTARFLFFFFFFFFSSDQFFSFISSFSHILFSLSLSLSLSLPLSSDTLTSLAQDITTRPQHIHYHHLILPRARMPCHRHSFPCASLFLSSFSFFFLKFPHPFSRLYFLSLSLFSLLSSLFSLSGLMLISPCSSVACVLVMFFVFYV